MSDNFAQIVKAQADIVKIIGDYLKLRKTGAQNYTGLCPFHKEKTGSFSVNANHGYFYCFGCHEKGDVFTFVMKMDVVSFPEAVRAVATKAGIPLLDRIPWIGGFFGATSTSKSRTELIIFLTPRVIYDTNQISDATEELRQKVKGLTKIMKEKF